MSALEQETFQHLHLDVCIVEIHNVLYTCLHFELYNWACDGPHHLCTVLLIAELTFVLVIVRHIQAEMPAVKHLSAFHVTALLTCAHRELACNNKK